METLYRSPWAEQTCGELAWGAAGWAAVLVPLIMAGLYAILRLFMRRDVNQLRVLNILFLVLSPVLLIAVVWVFLTTLHQLQSIEVSDGRMVVDTCTGASAGTRVVEKAGVAGIVHRVGQSGGKSPKPLDEIVVSVRDEAPVIIPVWDFGRMNFAVLQRLVPREQLAAWANAMRARGETPPPEIACLVTGSETDCAAR